MKYRPAWREARYAGKTAAQRALSSNRTSDDPVYELLTGKAKRYSTDSGRCFCCGRKRSGMTTGWINVVGAVLICQDSDCKESYREWREV